MTVYISRKAKIKFNIKLDCEDVRRYLLIAIAALSLLALGLFTACMILNAQFTRVNIEAGERFFAEDIMGDGAVFGDDFDVECLDREGVYYFTVKTPDGDERVRLSVKDTRAPVLTLKDAYFAVGGDFPEPLDFIAHADEAGEIEGEYLTPYPELKKPGEHVMKVRYSDGSGNKTEIFEVKMIQIYDNEPPEMTLSPVMICEVGEAVEYKPHITLTDNCVGALSFEVDESGLDTSAVGDYSVRIVGRDAVGNKTEAVRVTVRVIDGYNESELNEMLGKIVDGISPEDRTREEICREIYKAVRKALVYTQSSEKGDIKRAAYHALMGGGGDCYSYFALSKLLLERCGIENLDIERAEGYTPDTHFWSMVNIGEDREERWYHFDATELRSDRYDHSGCLLTERQIDAYSKVREHFYTYDKSAYPTACEEIITPTPRLDLN